MRMSASRSIKPYLVTFRFSSSDNKFIILVKLGEIGYSSLAAINIETVASLHIWSLGKVYQPIM